jgi:hypothetical protein
MSVYSFTAPREGGYYEIRVGWHRIRENESFFGEVWRDGDDFAGEVLAVGLAGIDPIPTLDALRERMGDWSRFLPGDLHVAKDQETELAFVRIMGDGSSVSHYAVKRGPR